jgi:hypothetical protein
MKILLLITVCNLNSIRIQNQIQNIKKHKNLLEKYNIHPIFCTLDENLNIDKSYDVVCLSGFEEKYTNLARKIVHSFEFLYKNYKFDFIIKIDDDTIFNVDRLDLNVFNYDYIGKFFDNFTKNEIIINLPNYNINETIRLYPNAYSNTPFKYAGGNFYILSKKSIETIIANKDLLEDFYKENVRVSEDQFVGYCLRSENINKLDCNYQTKNTVQKVLQVTSNLTSLHPINNILFTKILHETPEKQLEILEKSSSLIYRKMLLKNLTDDIKSVVFDFVNSKKNSGMG